MSKKQPFNFQYPYEMGRLKATAYIIGFTFFTFFSLLMLIGSQNPLALFCALGAVMFSVYGLIQMIRNFPGAKLIRAKAKGAKTLSRQDEAKAISKEVPVDLPLPAKPKKRPAHEYQVLLNRLENNLEGIKARSEAVSSLVDEYFGGSIISAARYKEVMKSAVEVLEANYQNACQAVELFGTGAPTKARIEILQNYVEDSEEVVTSFDTVVDELLKLKQSSIIDEGDRLDQSLEELAGTTAYYARKENQVH